MANKLQELRSEIAQLDEAIMVLLKKRNECIKQIANLKASLSLPIEDKLQESKQLKFYQNRAVQYGLNFEFIKKLFTVIIAESKLLQKHNHEQ